MFLKRLDVIGFKSFAERISVDFVKGVTAVVGPNGSGKSNITDAIRWVLGEQSARSLRGGKMEDIIFAGSDSRKRLNLAEVTLTLDNDDHFLPIDFHEVSVTRRVYRSGESEFLINNQPCRLKDIIDLFMDSGLGKEAFSIISQGKVEEILSSKAEDRRSIFEEAAGVLKYKTRKKKAENKLFETQDNLNRVEDILHELEGQVEPLKIQASIAKDYLEKKKELEHVEIALTAYDIEELHGKWSTLKEKVQMAKEEELAESSAISAKEAKIEDTRDKIQALDESVDELQQVLLVTSEELEKLEGRKEVLKERKKNAVQNQEQLEEAIVQFQQKETVLKEELSKQEAVFETLQAEVKQLRAQVKEKQQALSLHNENVEEKIEQLKSDYFELLNSQASIRNELQLLDDQMSQSAVTLQRLADNNEKHLQERHDISARKAACETEFARIEQEIHSQVGAYRDMQTKYEQKKRQYEKNESALYQAYQYVQQARSKKDMLENILRNHSNFYAGVKSVLQEKDRLGGIIGAVSEHLTFDVYYQTALEIALGASSQHIIVEDEESATKAIDFLKRNRVGRATFLPLTTIKARTISSQNQDAIAVSPGFLGMADELVTFDTRLEAIFKNLLATTAIFDTVEHAREAARQVRYQVRMVTLDGTELRTGGSYAGGANRQNNSIFIKPELEDVTKRLAEMEEKTALLEQEVKTLKHSIQDMEKKLADLRETGEGLRLKQQDVKGQLYELQVAEKNINTHLELYDQEKSALSESDEERKVRKRKLEEELSAVSEKMKQLEEDIDRLTKQKQTQSSTKESLSNELTELKIAAAKKEQACKGEEDNLARLKKELTETELALKEAKEDLSFLTSEMSSSTSGEEKLEEAAKHKLNDKTKTIELIALRRDQRIKLQHGLDTYERELKEMKRLYKQKTTLLKDEEVKLGRMEVELDNLLQYLREEYSLSFEGAKEKYQLETDPEEARKRVKLIKLAIEELGTVNLGSIDEFERVNERYKFLSEQKEDLTEAKNTLFQVIEEMDEEMTKRFNDTFVQIRSHFDQVFRSLFGGGRAELRLTDPNDLLHSGVEIIAQPPGKKLQNLNLLSGGERALTAIALLFSILKVRPVPFCVLDEVEAALDEANVFRFAQYLKKYSSDTQFIVITHRKGTMEEADVLYGVTMQESGVSKVISVKLEETKEFVQSR